MPWEASLSASFGRCRNIFQLRTEKMDAPCGNAPNARIWIHLRRRGGSGLRLKHLMRASTLLVGLFGIAREVQRPL